MSRLPRRNVQFQERRRDGRDPPGAQAVDHQPGVQHATDDAERRADRGDDQSFATEQSAPSAVGQCPPRRACRAPSPAAATPSWNNSAMSITAAAIRKKLKPKKQAVKRRRAAGGGETLRFHGQKRHAERCRVEMCVARQERYFSAVPFPIGMRSKLIVPQRLGHSFFAVASDTNALGVVRYLSQ